MADVTDDTKPVMPPTEGAVHGYEALRDTAAALVGAAQREVRLFAPYLEPTVFNTGAVAGALIEFARRHPRNRVLVLIEDAVQVQRDNDRLVALARRLSDRVELRAVEENDRGARDLYLLADRATCLYRETMDRIDAVVLHQAQEIAARIERFDTVWERAEPVALRTLGL